MNAVVFHGGNASRVYHAQTVHISSSSNSSVQDDTSHESPATSALLALASQTTTAAAAMNTDTDAARPTQLSRLQSSEHLSGPLRRGKWTLAEEEYTAATIRYFCSGVLEIAYGTTLRSHLAQQLHCDPMRISKKLLPGTTVAGYKMVPKIGRRGYYPRLTRSDSDAVALQQQQLEARRHLDALRDAFLTSLDALREEEDEYERLEAHYRAYYSRHAPTHEIAAIDTAAAATGGRKRQRLEPEPTYPSAARSRTQQDPMLHPSIAHHAPQLQHEALPVLYNMRALAAVDAAASPRTPFVLPPLRLSLQRASAIMAATR